MDAKADERQARIRVLAARIWLGIFCCASVAALIYIVMENTSK